MIKEIDPEPKFPLRNKILKHFFFSTLLTLKKIKDEIFNIHKVKEKHIRLETHKCLMHNIRSYRVSYLSVESVYFMNRLAT